MNTPHETIEYKGHTIEIHLDPDPQNPRTECDNLGTMICGHQRYNLGDKHPYNLKNYNSWKEVIAAIENDEGCPIVALPLYLYDHSGLTINTTGFNSYDSGKWDWGTLGFIYVSYKKAKKEYGWKQINKKRLDLLKTYLTGEVECYDSYLTGDVYGYIVKSGTDEELNSCWGFIGDKDTCIEEAKGTVDCYVKDTLKKRINKLKELIKAKAPIDKRITILSQFAII